MRRWVMIATAVATLGISFQAIAMQNCWEEAGQRYNINPWLLYAIAKKESKLKPNAVNYNPHDRSTDIGLMQVNDRHLNVLARYGITRSMLFDPCTNINVGAWVLAGFIARHGNNTVALGAYNAGSSRKAIQAYKRQVYSSDVLEIYHQEMNRLLANQ